MIRRDLKVPDQPDRWVLFRQPHHATFAGMIADAWQSPCFTPLEPREEVLEAIRIHDDGWSRWEEFPQIDQIHGRPVAFNEMPLTQSLGIWQASIMEGAKHGALQAYAIAGHFARLLRAHGSWQGDSQACRLAEDFLVWSDQIMTGLRAEWCAASPQNTPVLAERALQFVRLFDALSLWFLCSERTEQASFSTPEGPIVTLRPIAPAVIAVDPWPFNTDCYDLSASGTAVPAVLYRSAQELWNAPTEEIELSWKLQPSNARI